MKIVNIWYFDPSLLNAINTIIEGSANLYTYDAIMEAVIGIILTFAILSDMLLDRNCKTHPKNKKTDYSNKN